MFVRMYSTTGLRMLENNITGIRLHAGVRIAVSAITLTHGPQTHPGGTIGVQDSNPCLQRKISGSVSTANLD